MAREVPRSGKCGSESAEKAAKNSGILDGMLGEKFPPNFFTSSRLN
jgi:hypothetical protein